MGGKGKSGKLTTNLGKLYLCKLSLPHRSEQRNRCWGNAAVVLAGQVGNRWVQIKIERYTVKERKGQRKEGGGQGEDEKDARPPTLFLGNKRIKGPNLPCILKCGCFCPFFLLGVRANRICMIFLCDCLVVRRFVFQACQTLALGYSSLDVSKAPSATKRPPILTSLFAPRV